MKENFLLDPQVIFLNHGSFGATPKPVFDCYQSWQRELERQPVEFIGRKSKDYLRVAREKLAAYFHTDANNLVYMTNVTVALNVVARSLNLKAGDEVLASDQEYGALDKTWRFLAGKQGFKYINYHVELPVTSQEKYVDDLWRGVTPNTRVIFISHISSPTSIIAPVKAICQRARSQGILTVVDGAHVAGQIPLDLDDLDVDFYGGNLHKWLCAPKGAGFLYANPRVQSMLEPLVVSFGWESDTPGPSRIVDLYEYTGTRDLSAFLSVPSAIDFQEQHRWDQVRLRTHQMAKECLERLTAMTGVQPLFSPESNWYAQMVAIPLPADTDLEKLKTFLLEKYHIEVPMVSWKDRRMVRVSFQAYNNQSELDTFCSAIQQFLAG